MTRTAEQLYMTQPSISQAIAELEQHYDTSLFDRIGKKLFLTEKGRELLSRANGILQLYEDTEQTFRDQTNRRCIRLGASATVGSFLLPSLLQTIRQQDASLEIQFRVDNTSQIETALLHGELDFALVEGRIQSTLLQTTVVLQDELVLVVSPALLPNHQKMTRRTLGPLPFLMREKGSGTAEQAQEILASWKITPRIVGIANSIETLHRLVRCGAGLAFLPRVAVAEDLETGSLKEIRLGSQEIKRSFQLVHPASRKIEGDLAKVRDCILALGVKKKPPLQSSRRDGF